MAVLQAWAGPAGQQEEAEAVVVNLLGREGSMALLALYRKEALEVRGELNQQPFLRLA